MHTGRPSAAVMPSSPAPAQTVCAQRSEIWSLAGELHPGMAIDDRRYPEPPFSTMPTHSHGVSALPDEIDVLPLTALVDRDNLRVADGRPFVGRATYGPRRPQPPAEFSSSWPATRSSSWSSRPPTSAGGTSLPRGDRLQSERQASPDRGHFICGSTLSDNCKGYRSFAASK
jgi:hypothetical protein